MKVDKQIADAMISLAELPPGVTRKDIINLTSMSEYSNDETALCDESVIHYCERWKLPEKEVIKVLEDNGFSLTSPAS